MKSAIGTKIKNSARQFALNKFNSLAVAKVTCECLLQVKIHHLLPARSGVQVSDCDHEALRLLDMQSGEAHRSPPQTTRIRPKNPYRIKVFWFFFSKKNRFLIPALLRVSQKRRRGLLGRSSKNVHHGARCASPARDCLRDMKDSTVAASRFRQRTCEGSL